MAGPLANLIRQKYPGVYDDIDDDTLEKLTVEKYPEYEDLIEPPPEVTTEIPRAPVIEEVTPEIEPEKGILRRGYEAITEPTIQKPESLRAAEESFTQEHPVLGTVGKFATDVLYGLTSPLDIATVTLSGGAGLLRGRLPQIAGMMQTGARATGIPTAVHGATELFGPESTLPERAIGAAEMIGGRAAMKAPSIKPSVTEEITEEVVPKIKTVTSKTADTIPQGTIVTIKSGKDVPTKVKQAMAAGFEFDSVDETGNFRFKKTKPSTGIEPTLPGKELTRREELLTQEQLKPDIPIEERKVKPIKEPSKIQQAYDLPRGLMSTDLPFMTSAAFRQASPLAWTSNWFRAWGKAAGAYKSQEAFDVIMEKIKSNKYAKPKYEPLFDAKGNIKSYREKPPFSEEVGLQLTDLGDISKREEVLRSQWAEKLPWVKASNRSYTAFLNDLRINKFEQLVDHAKSIGRDPEKDLVLAKKIADFVNAATGRGKLEVGLKGGAKIDLASTQLLTNTLFSPRLIASRIEFLKPQRYFQSDSLMRKEYWKGIARSVGTWWGLATLAEMGGAQVSKDPTNADFGKIKIGDTRIDPGAGFQQHLTLLSRQATGKTTSSTSRKETEIGRLPLRYDPRVTFAINKLHPVTRLAWDMMNADRKNPVNFFDRTVQMVLPMMTQDIIDAAKDDPELAAIIAPLSSIGFGAQTYEPGSFNKPAFIPPEYDIQMRENPISLIRKQLFD